MNRLFVLLWSAVLLTGPSIGHPSGREASGSSALDARLVLRGYEATVEEHLRGVLNGLKALAATEEAMSGDWEHLKGPLARYAESVKGTAAVWFAEPDGSYFTVEKGRTGKSLRDRAYFAGLMHGRDVEGSLIVSKSTGARAVIVATPVMKDGHVTGALGASLSAVKLARRVNEQIAFPDDVVFYALDDRGRTALHKDSSLIFEFPSDIGDESLKEAVHRMLSEPQGSVHYTFRGERRSVIFRKSGSTGWVFALGTTRPD